MLDEKMYGIQFVLEAAQMEEQCGKSEKTRMYTEFSKVLTDLGCVKAGTTFYTLTGFNSDKLLEVILYHLHRLKWTEQYLRSFDAFRMTPVHGVGAVIYHNGSFPTFKNDREEDSAETQK